MNGLSKKYLDWQVFSAKFKKPSYRHGSPESRLQDDAVYGIPAIWIPAIHAGMT